MRHLGDPAECTTIKPRLVVWALLFTGNSFQRLWSRTLWDSALEILLNHTPEMKSIDGERDRRLKMTRPAKQRPEEELPVVPPLLSDDAKKDHGL